GAEQLLPAGRLRRTVRGRRRGRVRCSPGALPFPSCHRGWSLVANRLLAEVPGTQPHESRLHCFQQGFVEQSASFREAGAFRRRAVGYRLFAVSPQRLCHDARAIANEECRKGCELPRKIECYLLKGGKPRQLRNGPSTRRGRAHFLPTEFC